MFAFIEITSLKNWLTVFLSMDSHASVGILPSENIRTHLALKQALYPKCRDSNSSETVPNVSVKHWLMRDTYKIYLQLQYRNYFFKKLPTRIFFYSIINLIFLYEARSLTYRIMTWQQWNLHIKYMIIWKCQNNKRNIFEKIKHEYHAEEQNIKDYGILNNLNKFLIFFISF